MCFNTSVSHVSCVNDLRRVTAFTRVGKNMKCGSVMYCFSGGERSLLRPGAAQYRMGRSMLMLMLCTYNVLTTQTKNQTFRHQVCFHTLGKMSYIGVHLANKIQLNCVDTPAPYFQSREMLMLKHTMTFYTIVCFQLLFATTV